MFDLLWENMSRIDPTGNTKEQDFKLWMSFIVPELEKDERNVILLKCGGQLAGYFRYYVKEETLAKKTEIPCVTGTPGAEKIGENKNG